MGIALLGAFVAGGAARFTAGLRTAMLVAGAAYALGALLALSVPRGVRGGAGERDMAEARR